MDHYIFTETLQINKELLQTCTVEFTVSAGLLCPTGIITKPTKRTVKCQIK